MILWIQLRHFKAYKWSNFIPVWEKYNFISYAWSNGIWKSSILEALDVFFNNKDWLLTKNEIASHSFICPICLIPKNNVTRLKKDFEMISEYFWGLDRWSHSSEFFSIREQIKDCKDDNFLIFLWEDFDRNLRYPFWDKRWLSEFLKYLSDNWIANFDAKKFLKELKELYSYVYLPVELNMETFTKIETLEMQKLLWKDLKEEIKNALSSINLDKKDGLNEKLKNFLLKLSSQMQNYEYETWKSRNNNITQNDLVDKILEVYFLTRTLYKKENGIKKAIKELSAWEKRQALIDLLVAFIKLENEREKILLIWIDEPENSLHTSICYDQFEKLKEVSKWSQVLITTHWYWFLPIIDRWYVHFLDKESDAIEFKPVVDLYEYDFKTKNIPKDFFLKSTNDLVQSIFYSLRWENPYNWILCEWISDKIYLEYFLRKEIENQKLRIIAVWWRDMVKKFYKYLRLPISENIWDISKWKVLCITDTDSDLVTSDIHQDDPKLELIFKIVRFAKKQENISNDNFTSLVKFDIEQFKNYISIENSLNPEVFVDVFNSFEWSESFWLDKEKIIEKKWNTTRENLRNFDFENFFNIEKTKIEFAKKYIEYMNRIEKGEFSGYGNVSDYTPSWIHEIKDFFK